ncbi:hypothetical protein IT399_00205 [Candidatus Nomurabacteria bacterium]|nr:hypothetical protein [Candidatus Nomurabacteria bacterium]
MTEKILPFPKGNNWFVWKTYHGETIKLYKGKYAILKRPDGKYYEEYINPNIGVLEDAILEFGNLSEDEKEGVKLIEKVEINSRRDFEDLLKKIEALNKNQ